MFIQQQSVLYQSRKKSPLSQSDLGFIMELPGNYNISRWEQDERTPNLNMMIVYHLVFEIPLETLFQFKIQELTIAITKRIELLIKTLKILPPDPKVQRRIEFLTQTLARLIN